MPEEKSDPIEDLIASVATNLRAEISLRFVPIPSTSCECGKPVVFVHPNREFTCSRCGRKYALEIKISAMDKD